MSGFNTITILTEPTVEEEFQRDVDELRDELVHFYRLAFHHVDYLARDNKTSPQITDLGSFLPYLPLISYGPGANQCAVNSYEVWLGMRGKYTKRLLIEGRESIGNRSISLVLAFWVCTILSYGH